MPGFNGALTFKTIVKELCCVSYTVASSFDYNKWFCPIQISRLYHLIKEVRVRDTTLTNHWHICIQQFTSISCKHLISFCFKWKLDRVWLNWIWNKHIADFKIFAPYPRSTSLKIKNSSINKEEHKTQDTAVVNKTAHLTN